MKEQTMPRTHPVTTAPSNPSRRILEKDVFARFALNDEIVHLKFTDVHFTDALVAPLKDAPELAIVFMYVDRPFSFSSDAGYMEVLPAKCAKDPLNLNDPKRIVYLAVTANRCPARCPSDCKSDIMLTPMEPNIKCRLTADSASESCSVVLALASFILRRGREECDLAREITRRQLTDVRPAQAVPLLATA